MAPELSMSMQLLSGLIKNANALVRRDDYTIRRWVGSIEEIKFPSIATPIFGVSTRDLYTGDKSCCPWFRLFIPHKDHRAGEDSSRPVVVYYHGGGFAVLRPDFMLYDIFCRRLAKAADCIVVSVNYPLSPENAYPYTHDSSFKFIRWLKYNLHLLPEFADVSRLFLSGDSAGGNIAHYVTCKAAAEGVDLSPIKIRGNILVNPFFGGEKRVESEIELEDGPIINLEMTDWYWKAYLPKGEDRDHPICNVFGPRAGDGVSGLDLPPCLVIVGEYDLLRDWQLGFVQGLRQAGKNVKLLMYKKGVHVFHIFCWHDMSERVLVDISEFINSNIGSS